MNTSILNAGWVGLTRQKPTIKASVVKLTQQSTAPIPASIPASIPAPQLSLEPLTSAHAQKLLQLMSPIICRGLGIGYIDTLAKAKNFIAGVGSDQKNRLAITHHQYGFIGGLGYRIYAAHDSKSNAMLSYWLGEQWQGQGYAYNALTLLFKQLKAQGVECFKAQVYGFNLPSQKLLKKLGFCCQQDSGGDMACLDFQRSE